MNDFKFFIPIDLEKGKSEKKGEEKMLIKGIASTIDRDSDDESLDPNGFELGFFLKSGFLNWHHRAKDDPSAIVGEPTKAEVVPEGLYLEGELYPDSELAKSIYSLAKTLNERKSTRRLGFSIEGKVLERDPLDKSKINKALITGCAITPTPKNPYTIMDVIKGIDTSGDLEFDLKKDPKSADANGGKSYIVDVSRPDGSRVTVDEDFNVNVSKTLDTQSGSALITESVEGSVKKKEDFTVTDENSKLVNKSKAFAKILRHVEDVEKAQRVYEFINKKQKGMSQEDKTQEDLTSEEIYKALETLGLEPGSPEEVSEEVTKGEESEEIEKATEDNNDSEDNEEMSKEEYEKLQNDVEKAKEDYEAKKAKLESSSHAANKGGTQNISKGEEEDIEKAETPVAVIGEDKKAALATIVKAFDGVSSKLEKLDEIEKSLKIVDNVSKSLEELDEIKKSIESINSIEERLKKVENQPVGRKSVSTKKFIEKSFQGDEMGGGGKELSVSQNKNEVIGLLKSKSGIEKGEINNLYADALMEFETTGTISKGIAEDLRHNDNIILTQ